MATTLDAVMEDIRRIQADARERGVMQRPTWPMIVLRTPKGWTCPTEIDGKLCEGYWRSHQVPMGDMDKQSHMSPGAVAEGLPPGALRRWEGSRPAARAGTEGEGA
jgi:phosphoketolase